MAKGKSRSRAAAYHESDRDVHVRRSQLCVTNLGLPEVDGMNIMNRLQFKLNCSSSPRTSMNSIIPDTDEDVINKLPDDILQSIISGLAIRERVATSILARRWRFLWNTSGPSLDFDIPTMHGYDCIQHMLSEKYSNERIQLWILDNIPKFTQWVDWIFKHRPGSSLDALRVRFVLDQGSASCIDTWIKSAAAWGVTDIELDLCFIEYLDLESELDLKLEVTHLYEFPPQQASYSSLKYLRLKNCIFRLPPDFIGFTSLVSLALHLIKYLTQSVVDNILSKCPLLECLSLVNCDVLGATILKFSGPSLPLKHLHIQHYCDYLDVIEVHDINLLSLELTGLVPDLTLKNVPHLARLLLLSFTPIVTLSDIPSLEILFMRQTYKNVSILPLSYEFNNLKRLVIVTEEASTDLLGVVNLLETFHLLQELEINMGHLRTVKHNLPETLSKLSSVPHTLHYNLKKIEMYGFEARPERIEFAKYLLKYAIVLDSMKISITSKTYCGNGNWTLYEGAAEENKLLKKVDKKLRKVARSSTKLELSSSLDL